MWKTMIEEPLSTSPFFAASAANEINQLERNKLKVKILTLLVFCARDSAQPTSQVRLEGGCLHGIIFSSLHAFSCANGISLVL